MKREPLERGGIVMQTVPIYASQAGFELSEIKLFDFPTQSERMTHPSIWSFRAISVFEYYNRKTNCNC